MLHRRIFSCQRRSLNTIKNLKSVGNVICIFLPTAPHSTLILYSVHKVEFLLRWHHKMSPHSLVFNFVSELFMLINVEGCENNLVRAALQRTYYSNNKLLIKQCRRKVEVCSYTMSLAWIMYHTISKMILSWASITVSIRLSNAEVNFGKPHESHFKHHLCYI